MFLKVFLCFCVLRVFGPKCLFQVFIKKKKTLSEAEYTEFQISE